MINPTTSFHSATADPSSFRTGIHRVDPAEPPRGRREDEIVANHTAIKPSRVLFTAYTVESIVTGLPLLIVDLLVTGGGLILASYLVNLTQGSSINAGIWIQLPVLLMLQTLMMSIHQMYPGAGVVPVAELRGIVRSTCFALLCLSATNVMLGQLPRIEFVTFACTALLVSIALPLARWAARDLLARTRWWGVRMLLVGRSEDCQATMRMLNLRRSSGFIPVGYACDDGNGDRFGAAAGGRSDMELDAVSAAQQQRAPVAGLVSQQGARSVADRLIFQFPAVVWVDCLRADRNEKNISRLPIDFRTQANMPFLRLMPRVCKRGLDLAFCIPALILLALPMAMLALAIKCLSPGPVIYASRRVGQHGKMFNMWKFRSMVHDADQVLQQKLEIDTSARAEWERNSKLRSDPRIIPGIGHLLRRWSLDELPQLWNVLIGEMSLVGPRPVPPNEIVRYQQHYYEYTQMWPGITGLWQVSGRNDTTFKTRISLVQHYARHWSLWLDLWVLLRTPSAVMSRKGAY